MNFKGIDSPFTLTTAMVCNVIFDVNIFIIENVSLLSKAQKLFDK